MAEIRTVTTLRTKADEIRSSIIGYERRLAQARADLSHVNSCIAIFEASGDVEFMPKYVDVHRLYQRGELWAICKRELEKAGRLSTKELAALLIAHKGLDTDDAVLAKSICLRAVQALRMQERRNKVIRAGKKAAAILWTLPIP